MEGGDSHDERLVRVRESLQRGNHIDRGVRNVVAMVTSLASLIGTPHFAATVVGIERATDVGRSSR